MFPGEIEDDDDGGRGWWRPKRGERRRIEGRMKEEDVNLSKMHAEEAEAVKIEGAGSTKPKTS